MNCRKCGSSDIVIQDKGFDVGGAISGGFIAGWLGAIIGGGAEIDHKIVGCNSCGHKSEYYPNGKIKEPWYMVTLKTLIALPIQIIVIAGILYCILWFFSHFP